MKKMTIKIKNEIIEGLYTIININRVGSDEIEVLETIISNFENKKLVDITKKDLSFIQCEINDLLNWSDRLGGDEISIIKNISSCIDNLI